MKNEYDVVIVGGGMVGATLASALGNSSLKVALLDRSTAAEPMSEEYDRRVSAITLASRTVFEHLGAWEGMARRRVAPVAQMQVWSGADEGSIHFDAAEIGEPALAYIIENRVIRAALLECLNRFTNVHLLAPVEIAELTIADNGAAVTLRDGRSLRANLLVGADGQDSDVRRAAGIETQTLDLHQQGIVATVTTEKPHAATARQRFLPSGPLAFLPLPEPCTCSIVWSVDNVRAEHLLALDDAGFVTELESAFGDSLGKIRSLSARAAFPLTLMHTRSYTAPHVALVGDSAHTVHPLAGQGVNLGVLDAATLAEVVLDASAKHKDVGAHEVVRRYERWRKGENLAMLTVTGGFKYLFGNDWPVVRQLRNWGLNLTDAATPVKHFIMRRASGLEGDLPKLARRNWH